MHDTITKLKNIYDLADEALDMDDEGIINALYDIRGLIQGVIDCLDGIEEENN